MHFSWVSGGNEQWFSHWATPITDLASATFFISFFQGDILDTSPCDRSGIRRIEACEFCCSTTSRATWRGGSGYPHSSYKKALSFCIYCTATAFWNNTFFFSKRKKCMILSLIWLYLFQPVIENRAIRGLQAVGLNADQAEHTEYTSANSSYLAAFFPVCTVEMNI